MDALMDHQAAVDDVVTTLLRPMVDQDLSMVFYDLTTIRAASLFHFRSNKQIISPQEVNQRRTMARSPRGADNLDWAQEVLARAQTIDSISNQIKY
jgi:hypothetical protein